MNESTDAVSPGVRRALTLLHDRHERISRARQAVVQVLDQAGGHLSADEVEHRVEVVAPGVHRATVYRTLSTLSELGIVQHMHVGGGPAMYRLGADDTGGLDSPMLPRAHAQCTTCGRLFDVPNDAVDRLSDRLLDEVGFQLEPSHAALLGVCADCRNTTVTVDA